MKQFFSVAACLLTFAFSACNSQTKTDGNKKAGFSGFENTPLAELAEAVVKDDGPEIKRLFQENPVNLNLKEPNQGQTLLSLSIVKNKKEAFLALLKLGANPNTLIGFPENTSPLVLAINHQHNCNTFYLENLLKNGADPNLEINNPNPEKYFDNNYPLLRVMTFTRANGEDCLNMAKVLVDNGANINVCGHSAISGFCEGVITKCLLLRRMQLLKYFVVEKQIEIPEVVVVTRLREYSLLEYLKTDRFEFGSKGQDEYRRIRDEIIFYLQKNGK